MDSQNGSDREKLFKVLTTIRDDAWRVRVNNGWNNQRAALMASKTYELAAEAVGPHPDDTSRRS